MIWWLCLITAMICPLSMYFLGFYLERLGSREINKTVGYRTKNSMLSRETWKFANKYCGKLWRKFGLITLALTLLIFFFFLKSSEGVLMILLLVVMAVQIGPLIASVLLTEKELKKKFN